MSNLSQAYTLITGASQVQISIISTGAYILQAGSTDQETSISCGQIGGTSQTVAFTVNSPDQYVLAMVETQYAQVNLADKTAIDPPSYCHIYFKLGSSDWYWMKDAQTADNVTIFPPGNVQMTTSTITIQPPTAVNPNGIPSKFPTLNSDLVFLLDKSSSGNMLFRGNEPLTPGMTGQHVDFEQLHRTLQTKYNLQTGLSDFPEIGKYILRDIAFLNPQSDEGDILSAEIASFNATSASQVNQAWHPVTPTVLSGKMLGQVSNWNVEPSDASLNLNVEFARCLSSWMNTVESLNNKPVQVIYYIHCSSGHDRTGMMASAYLMENYNIGLSEAFILGTTIHALSNPMGGNLIQTCYDVTSGDVDPLRSRCFVAGDGTKSTYNDTIKSMSDKILSNTNSFSAQSVSGDPAIGETGKTYVHSYYPWKKYISVLTPS